MRSGIFNTPDGSPADELQQAIPDRLLCVCKGASSEVGVSGKTEPEEQQAPAVELNLLEEEDVSPKKRRTEKGEIQKEATPVAATVRDTGGSASSVGEGSTLDVIRQEYNFLAGSTLCRCQPYDYTIEQGVDATVYKTAKEDLKKAHWLRVKYPCTASTTPRSISDALETNLPKILYDVVVTSNAADAMIYKSSYENIRASLTLPIGAPTSIETAVFPIGTGRAPTKVAQKLLVEAFQQQAGQHRSNMSVMKTVECTEMTAATVMEQTKTMSCHKFANFVLDSIFKQKEGVELTPLEDALCDARVESRVKELRKLTGRVINNVVYASQAKEQVQAAKVFKDTWKKLKVTIHDTQLLTPCIPRCSISEGSNQITLENFLTCKELNQSVSLFLPGRSRTGKTELAKLLCLHLACTYQQDAAEDVKFIMVNTLDSLRNCQACMLPGVPVLLDDIGGDSNETQLIYSSVGLWKAVLQVPNASQNRARNDDICWAPKQPNIVTTNCEDLNDRISTMFSGSQEHHTEAIRMCVAEVETINSPLYVNSCMPSGSQNFMEPRYDSKQVSEMLSRLLE